MFGLGIIEDLVNLNIEKIGRELLVDFIESTPLGAAISAQERFSSFIETGGESEVERLIGGMGLKLPSVRGEEYLKKIVEIVKGEHTDRRRFKWQRGGWAKSRQQWLDEGWKHDWRSQPRDLIGRWIPGRLDYPYQKKLGVSRRQRMVRRFRTKYRKAGRSAARGIISSWGLKNAN